MAKKKASRKRAKKAPQQDFNRIIPWAVAIAVVAVVVFAINTPAGKFVDTDGDGLTEDVEEIFGSDPQNPDTDGDGLSDGDEFNKYSTDLLSPDTDGDGVPDGIEIQARTDPNSG